MNNPFDHIEEYLAGELSAEQNQYFEKAMLKDASLRDEVEMVKEMELFAQRKAENQNALDVVQDVMEEGRRVEEGVLGDGSMETQVKREESEDGTQVGEDERINVENKIEQGGKEFNKIKDSRSNKFRELERMNAAALERRYAKEQEKETVKDNSVLAANPQFPDKLIWIPIIISLLMGLIGMLYGHFMPSKKILNSNEQLFVEYFDPETISFMTKSLGDINKPIKLIKADSLLNIAEFSFNQRDFVAATKYIDQYHALIDTINPAAQYLNSLAMLGSGKPELSIRNFDLVIDMKNLYENDLKWYKALAYLRIEDYDAAESELLKINPKSVRYSKSQKLRMVLSNFLAE